MKGNLFSKEHLCFLLSRWRTLPMAFLIFFGSLSLAQSVATQTFYAEGYDSDGTVLSISPSDITVNEGQSIQQVQISNFVVHYDEPDGDTIYCGDWFAFDFEVNGGNSDGFAVTEGCNSDVIDTDVTGFIDITTTSVDLDDYSDYVYFDLTLEVTYETPSCPAPSELTAGNLTFESADLSWTSDGNTFDISWGEGTFAAEDGTIEIGFVNGGTLSGLDSNTTYQYYVKNDCGGGDVSGWAGPYSFTTPCESVTSFPFIETFNADSSTKNCWKVIDGNSDGDKWNLNGTGNPRSGMSAELYTDYNSSNNDYLITPQLDLGTEGKELKFWVRHRSDGEPDNLRVKVSTSGSEISDFAIDLLYLTTTQITTTYTEYTIDLSSYSGLVYIAFARVDSPADGWYLYIDDVSVEDIPSCIAPTDLTADNITTESAELSWTGDGDTFDINWGEGTFAAGEGVTITNFTNGGTLPGLDSSTTYQYYVRQNCGGGDLSSWAGPYGFTTACAAVTTFPWTEDFQGVTTPNLPSCWGYIDNNSDTDYWKTYTTYGVGGSTAAGLNTDFNNGNNDDYLILPLFTLTGNEQLKFSVRARSSSEPNDYRVVLSTTGNSASDFNVELKSLTAVSNTTHEEITPIDLSDYIGDVYIAIHVPSGGLDGYYIYFDDFTIEPIPACPAPIDLTASNITTGSADLSWISDGDTFDINWGQGTFAAGEGTTETGFANGGTLSGLEPDTTYNYYVRRDCNVAGEGTSVWAGPYSFFTGYCIPTGTSNSYRINGVSTEGGYLDANISNLSNGTSNAYNDYTDMVVSQYPGAQITYHVAVPSSTAIKIWVDLNQDLVFDEDELVASHLTYSSATTWTGTITVPEDLALGDYRMRIRSGYYYYPTQIYACGANYSNYGEAEDYTLSVVAPPACLPPSELTHTQLSVTSANLSWVSDGTAFEVKWDEAGFDVETEGTAVSGIPETSLEVPGLTTDTEYEFYVRRDCSATGDGFSTWAGPYSFSVGYCDSVPTSHDNSGITNVTVGDVSFPVASVNYYEYTDNIANIAAGTSITSSVTFLTSYTYDTHIWIDLNDDGIFDNATEKVYSGESLDLDNTPSVLDTTFPLPVDAAQGIHRMRIGTADSGQATPNPCYSGSYGVTVDLTVDISGPVTWTGTEWVNGSPSPEISVLINGNLNVGTDAPGLEVSDLTVSETGSVSIPAGSALIVNGAITNNAGAASFVVESDGNLIQNGTAANTGNITVKRNSNPMIRLDYTLWSSPVISQNLFGFSPETVNGVTNYPDSPGRIYIYDGANGYVNPDPFTADAIMSNGIGYLFRAPNNWSATDEAPYEGEFIGVPFNGDRTVNTYSGNYTSVGNPYPSNLSISSLYAANGDINTLYFWNNNHNAGNNYATCTNGGGCVAAAGGGGTPNGVISAGQGFIIETDAASITFNNSMRVDGSGSFFKADELESHRMWLNLNGANDERYNQILVGYIDEATNGVDLQIDGKMFDYNGSALYNMIDEQKFVIQGRALPFEVSDVVPLGFRAAQAGKFYISLANFDGLFAEGEATIYLKDNSMNVVHNLMESDYMFESVAGEFKNRFEIVYQAEEGTMGIDDLTANGIMIYKNAESIEVSSINSNIVSVDVFDLQGRRLFSESNIHNKIFQIKSDRFATQVLIVKVKTVNGVLTNKKIVNN